MTLFDLSGIDGFEEFLAPLAESFQLELGTADDLATLPLTGLSEHAAILSDNRFSEQQTDNDIIEQIQGLVSTGLHLLYLGTPRGDLSFLETLEGLGVQTFFREELDPKELEEWLTECLSTWQANVKAVQTSSESVAETIMGAPVHPSSGQGPGCPRCIVISGAPGCGTTFVGLNLASTLAQSAAVNYVEAGLRPALTTWLCAENEEEAASLISPLKPALLREDLAVYTRNPFGDETVDLREVAAAAARFVDPVVMDMGLQDYLSTLDHEFATETLRVLVTTADIHRCRYLEGVPADVVVINQTPKRLPFDEDEFRVFWPEAKLVFVPYEEEQCAAVAQGLPVLTFSEPVRSAMERLKDALLGGGDFADRVAG